MTFVKAHRKTILLALAGVAVLLLLRAWEGSHDDTIAQLMADRVMAKYRAVSKALVAKYAALNAAKDAEIVALRARHQAKAAEVNKFRVDSEAKQRLITELQPCMALLDECQQYIVDLEARRTIEAEEISAAYLGKLALKDAEIAEWRAKDEASISIIGDMTKRLVKMQLDKQRRLVIGPQIHYGTGGMSIGVGATYDLGLRFKVGGA